MNKPDLFGDEPMTCRHLDVVVIVRTRDPIPGAGAIPSYLLGTIHHIKTRNDRRCYLHRPFPDPHNHEHFYSFPEWAVVHICDPRLVQACSRAEARHLPLRNIIERFYRER